MKITLQHLRSLPVDSKRSGYCSKGTRLFFQRHELDWDTAKTDGIDEEQLLATGDAQAKAVVEWAHQLETQKNG